MTTGRYYLFPPIQLYKHKKRHSDPRVLYREGMEQTLATACTIISLFGILPSWNKNSIYCIIGSCFWNIRNDACDLHKKCQYPSRRTRKQSAYSNECVRNCPEQNFAERNEKSWKERTWAGQQPLYDAEALRLRR